MTRSQVVQICRCSRNRAVVWATGAYTPIIDILAHRSHKTETAATVAPPTVTVSRVKPADLSRRFW